MILERLISLEFVSFQLMSVIYAILQQFRENPEVLECLARSEDVFIKYS